MMSRKRDSTLDQVIRIRKQLVELGVVEDSGERHPDSQGKMQIAWQLSAFGQVVVQYQLELGLTFEEALAKAKTNTTH